MYLFDRRRDCWLLPGPGNKHFQKGPHLPFRTLFGTWPSCRILWVLENRTHNPSCGQSILLMSRRPNLWSYISFGSPQQQSYSLPTQNPLSLGDPDKVASPKRGILSGGRADAYAMNGGQRSRLMKGGLVFLVFILLYLFTTRNTASVLNLGNGMSSSTSMPRTTNNIFQDHRR